VTAAQPEQKFHRPFEVASRADAAGHSNKLAKPPHSNSTPDRPPPPLLHRSTSERNGTTPVEVQRRQPHAAAARLDAKFGTSAADETPLNLVVGRHGSSQSQHWSAGVNCTNTSDSSHSVLQPSMTSDGWHRQRNKSSSSSFPVVSLLDRKSMMKASRQKLLDGNSSDEDPTNDDDDVLEAKRLARLLLIMSGPTLEPDNSPSKMKFLQQFGLVTSSTRAGKSSILVIVQLLQHLVCLVFLLHLPRVWSRAVSK